MVTITESIKTTWTASLKREWAFIREGHAFVLLTHQLLLLFRHPIGYWIFGGALFLISASFSAQYNGYAQETYYDLSKIARIGLDLLHYYRIFSLLTIALFVPVIGVSAISQEREAKTLDLMLTTPVPPLELVFSKAAASLSVVFVSIFATSPIIALTLSMGGVGPHDIVTLIVHQFILACISISVGLAMGARMPTFMLGLISSYSLLILLLIPANQIFTLGRQSPSIFVLLPNLLLTFLLCSFLLRSVPHHLAKEINKIRPISWRPISIKGIDAQLWTFLGTRDYGAPIESNENPVYVSERERFLAFVTRRDFDAPSILWLISIFLFYWALIKPIVMLYLSMAIALFFIPGVGASMFSGEHQRASWECLRSSLIRSRQIFWGKWRLTAGQGLIHVFAFYIPSLLILGLIWLLIGLQTPVSYFQSINTISIWLGHLLIMSVLIFLVCFLTSLALWVSSLYKRNFVAWLTSYGLSAFFLFSPQFLALMHPRPGPTLGGNNPMDGISIFLSIWHAPFLFKLWPLPTTQAVNHTLDPLFWELYLSHLILLVVGSIFFCLMTRLRIQRSDD